MKWKNLKLGIKFAVGFGIVLILLAVVGIWAVTGIGGIVGNAGEVIEGNKLKAEMIQKEVDHLNWAGKVSALLTDENINKLNVQTDPHKCGFGKWYYSDERIKAEKLVPDLKPIFAKIEKHHNLLHESAIRISKNYANVDQKLGSFLREKKVDHVAWVGQVLVALLDNSVNRLDVETDSHKCDLGKWYFSEATRTKRNNDPEFDALLSKIETPHKQLHEAAITVNQMLKNNNRAGAKNVYTKTIKKAAHDTLLAISNVIKWHDNKLAKLEVAKQINAKETQPALAEVQKVIGQLIETMSKNIMTDQQMLDKASTTKSMVVIIAIIAILIGIIMAFVIAIGIIKPILKGVEFAKTLSDGDLTAELDIDQKDEVGDLGDAMKSMAENLKRIVYEVQTAADNVASGSEELSASSQSLSQGATEQASAAEEISSSMEEMGANIQQNTDNAQQTEKISSKASSNAKDSGDAVNEATTAMKEITEKINIIQEIARQTNLLALNAAIEAARAGEHGKGFAVVASEVRKLAERSQGAAEEITELAKNSLGVAEKAVEMLEVLVPDIGKTADLVSEITASSTEQNQGAGQIVKAINELDKVVQSNAGASEEMASTAEELSSQAQQLQSSISFFKIGNDGGYQAARVNVPRQAPVQTQPKKAVSPKPIAPKSGGMKLEMGGGADNEDSDFERF